MSNLGSKVAKGAVWMVAMRFIERAIGLVSTLILARLLIPEDFGVVAMAMAVIAFVEIAGQFGFDIALIRDQNATRAQYDSAWTISVIYGAFGGALLAVAAGPAATFFSDPRLEPIIYVLAFATFVQGFENIGIIDFRKNLAFNKDFHFAFAKKLISFAITVVLAFQFRSYWALVAGMTASRLAGVALSFAMHPYRPRFNLEHVGSLFRFSRWIVLTRIIEYLGGRGPDFIMGRYLDAAALGLYRVGREISTLPTSELIAPIMRAVFPGYAAVAHDRSALARSFLGVQGILVTLALPAGIGIVMVAEPLVLILLGPNWVDAIPVIQILGVYGAITVFQATNISIFNVLGVPHWTTGLKAVESILMVSSVMFAVWNGHGLLGACFAILAVQALLVPAGMAMVSILIEVRFRDRLSVSWRPMVATAVLGIVVHATDSVVSRLTTMQIPAFLITILAGALTYILALLLMWRLSGRPEGPETLFLSKLISRLQFRRH